MTERQDLLGTSHGELPINASTAADPNTELAIQRLAREARANNAFVPRPRQIEDVTETFLSMSAKLEPGQLVKDPYFTLFEAVGALEIMDPKMDSGYLEPGDSFELDFDVAQSRSPEEIIWIMDQIMNLEAAWHDGYPLSQTVFTSLHIDHLLYPDTRPPYTFLHGQPVRTGVSASHDLVHIVLRAYCIAVAKCCHYALLIVQRQNYYEEEDFVTHLFGRELLPATDVDEIEALLAEASQWLKACTTISQPLKDALEARIHFRQLYLLSISDIADDWNELERLISQLDASHALAVEVPTAFSEKVQRRLATSTPPRPMLEVSWATAIIKWRSMCNDIVSASNLTSAYICTSPHALQLATWAFANRDPAPTALARAYFQDMLFGRDYLAENFSHFDLFLTDIRSLALAGDPIADSRNFEIEQPTDPRHQSAQILQNFMEKAFEEYLNIYRMVCQNRCRIRRTFTQALPLLDAIQTSAQECDTLLRDVIRSSPQRFSFTMATTYQPTTLWVKYYSLQIMSMTIQLGLETETYIPDELCMIYWLLNCTTSKRLTTLAQLRRDLMVRMEHATRTRNVAYLPDCLSSESLLHALTTAANVTLLMSQALWRLYSLLLQTNSIKTPPRTYAQQQLLYEARMKPYLGLRHDPIPTLDDFLSRQAELTSPETVFSFIECDLRDAKTLLAELRAMTAEQAQYTGTEPQWQQHLQQLEKTCIAIGVQSMQFQRINPSSEQRDGGVMTAVEVRIPTPSASYHPWWIVPQISRRTEPSLP